MRKYSRRFQEILLSVDKKRLYSPLEALNLLKNLSSVNFVETVEAHINLNLDPKYADQQLRSTVILPKGTGKSISVAVLTNDNRIQEAIVSGADIAGSQDLIDDILKGRLDFDKLIATPDIMLMVAKLGRILGPRGLMPSPKAGTVTNELEKTIKEFKAGKLEYRLDRTGALHIPFGKITFNENDLLNNLKVLQESIDKNKPSGSKGKYWKSMYLSSTMGPSLQLDISFLRDTII